jgi:hypothetical protein
MNIYPINLLLPEFATEPLAGDNHGLGLLRSLSLLADEFRQVVEI